MTLFLKYKEILESVGSTLYTAPGTGYSARVIPTKEGKHIAKFFKDGKHMTDADYGPYDEDDVHEFAQDEMNVRTKEAKKPDETSSDYKMKSTPDITDIEEQLDERINEPEGRNPRHEIAKETEQGDGRLNKIPIKKMMGNRTPLEIIAKILAGR